MNRDQRRTGTTGAIMTTVAMIGALAASAPAHAEPQGHLQDELAVGYFYSTFGEDPNVVLLVGGTAEQFCLDNPADPFNAEPGVAPLRVFLRNSGAVDLKVNDKDQPIFLYETADEAPGFIAGACAALLDGDPLTTVPAPLASGTADLKVRISIVSDDLVEVFNSVNGTAASGDGTEYKVRASADLVVQGGVPVGDPADFVDLTLTEIRRGA